MTRFRHNASSLLLIGVACTAAGDLHAQKVFTGSYHVTFDSPEGWAMKYFTSATIMSGLQPPASAGERPQIGSVNIGFETDWLPALNAQRASVGFSGRKQEDVNKAPVIMRPVVRVGLPWQFTAVVAAPPPIEVFDITPRLLAFGLERPLIQRERWSLGWRASGQVGNVKGAFTCPQRVLEFAPGSAGNPTGCVGTSADKPSLRYGGTEIQAAVRMPKVPKLTPHASLGFNYIDASFQVNAPLANGLDHTRLYTSGQTVTGTAGVSYFFTDRVAFTVDTFYSPLFIRRDNAGGRANDGMFNVRALVSYTVR